MRTRRKPIPANLQRELMLESGFRCAVCKAPEPLEIDHIVPWHIVKEHTFENMIVLCRNCHGKKSTRTAPRELKVPALKEIKQSLILVNGRYSDLEKRVIEKVASEINCQDQEHIIDYTSTQICLL